MNNDQLKLSEGWPQPGEFRKSIRLEFSLFMSAMILVLMLVSGYVVTEKYVTTTSRHIAKELLVQARSATGTAARHMLAAGNTDALMLNSVCSQLAADNPDICWVGIADPNDVFLAHTDIRQVVSASTLQVRSDEEFTSLLKTGESFSLEDDTVFVYVPIFEGDIKLGGVAIASSSEQIAAARRSSITTVASITLLFIALGIPVILLMLHFKLRPIRIITNALKAVDFNNMNISVPLNTRNEFGYLAETLRVMGVKLNLAQRDSLEKERMERELEIAREIQASILPQKYPESRCYRFAGAYQSAWEVGGDYHDLIELDADHLACVVADVSGKSLPAMLVMLLVRDMIKRLTQTKHGPAELLSAANRELFLSIREGMFVTMIFGVLNTKTGVFEFASAGHCPLVYRNGQSGRLELLKAKGFPLGLMEPELFEKRIETFSLALAEGDLVTLYTDGTNEAKNASGEQFGIERILNLHRDATGDSAKDLLQCATEEHREFIGATPLYDDMTLLVLQWIGKNATDGHMSPREHSNVSRT